ncbi:hypothetical protein WJX73_003322 [Symbiochloris irregularis]|uniref:Uncharacterized protein n=1 Tax=Symbiochloris irregularis TaxID=706552 RepID=A0AAW1NV22_9CHLO
MDAAPPPHLQKVAIRRIKGCDATAPLPSEMEDLRVRYLTRLRTMHPRFAPKFGQPMEPATTPSAEELSSPLLAVEHGAPVKYVAGPSSMYCEDRKQFVDHVVVVWDDGHKGDSWQPLHHVSFRPLYELMRSKKSTEWRFAETLKAEETKPWIGDGSDEHKTVDSDYSVDSDDGY